MSLIPRQYTNHSNKFKKPRKFNRNTKKYGIPIYKYRRWSFFKKNKIKLFKKKFISFKAILAFKAKRTELPSLINSKILPFKNIFYRSVSFFNSLSSQLPEKFKILEYSLQNPVSINYGLNLTTIKFVSRFYIKSIKLKLNIFPCLKLTKKVVQAPLAIFKSYKKNVVHRRFGWYDVNLLVRQKWYRKRLKRWYGKFPKIKKNKAFTSLLRSHFQLLTGFSESSLLQYWAQFRRGSNNYWSTPTLVQIFSQTLLLTPLNFLLFLNIVPSQAAAKIFIQSGGLVINGRNITNLSYSLQPRDIFQLQPQNLIKMHYLFNYHKSRPIQLALNYLTFFQIDWSLFIFILVRRPYSYELVSPSFLSERWVRYYIRQFPVKLKKFKKAKITWK